MTKEIKKPWEDEPDNDIWIDEYTAYHCFISRKTCDNPEESKRMKEVLGYHMVFLRGYVLIPIDLEIGDPDNIDVHGGVTYDNYVIIGYSDDKKWEIIIEGEEAKSLLKIQEWKNINTSYKEVLGGRLIGFDCAHAGDLAYNYPETHPLRQNLSGFNDIYRDIEYVRKECKKLAACISRNKTKFFYNGKFYDETEIEKLREEVRLQLGEIEAHILNLKSKGVKR